MLKVFTSPTILGRSIPADQRSTIDASRILNNTMPVSNLDLKTAHGHDQAHAVIHGVLLFLVFAIGLPLGAAAKR
jgi:hypothetical protein